ncbi:MAG: proline--tRNA ligase [Blastocatellia bacterium]|nr:proline--tRNA ligase [Blastocatellia bacterium]
MYWHNLFVPTLREHPADAEAVSHKLLVRGGFIRQLTAGVYSMLPLAQRTLLKITDIVREEMNAIGAQEFYLPALNPASVWRESGRWDVMGDNMFRLKDRKGAELCLGMTHEEIFTAIARNELRSYKQLPQIWYQIQTKFRDEPRPKSGVLRVRQFTMKDSYSFDLDTDGLDKSFDLHDAAYRRIYSRCGLRFAVVEASSGAMGGSASNEFMVASEAGEDWIASCASCGYAANVEKAVSRLEPVPDGSGLDAPEKFATPGIRTIEALVTFEGGAAAHNQIKTYVCVLDGKLTLALLRGDHELNETKIKDAVGANDFRPAQPDEIFEALGAHPGSLGAVGVTTYPVIADEALRGRTSMTTGANENDFHLRGVNVERDIKVTKWASLRTVKAGEGCPRCDATLEVNKSIEVGHIFKLGLKYSVSMGANVLTQDGREVPIVMGSYGIGVERIMAAAVELYHDADGICWPVSIAPFEVVVTPVNFTDEAMRTAAETIYRELKAAGVDVILDNRDERPGVKFKDADLVGIPFRIVVGPKKLKENKVEFFTRSTKTNEDLDLASVVAHVRNVVAEAKAKLR